MKIEGVVGPTRNADGVTQAMRLGQGGEQVVSQLSPRYYEQTYRGLVFSANSAAATSSAGLATTFTGGVCVSNPAGSTKNLVILKASSINVAIQSAVNGPGIITGYSSAGVVTHTTALVPVSNLVGSGANPVAKADQAATLVGTPGWVIAGFGSTGIAAGAWGATIDLEGLVVVPPGGYCAVGTVVASAATSVVASMTWMEISI